MGRRTRWPRDWSSDGCSSDLSSDRDWVTAMYMAWRGVGGTSGPLFGMFFRDLAKAGEAGSGADDESQNSEAAPEGERHGATTPTLTQFAEALALPGRFAVPGLVVRGRARR